MTLREESGNGPPPAGETVAGPQEPPATPEPTEGHLAPAEADPAADPTAASAPSEAPGGPDRPARRRPVWAAVLIGGVTAVCLLGLGGLAAFLLQHGRAHAQEATLPSVFRLHTGECVNSGPRGVDSPSVVPCGQAHDAEIYATFGLTDQGWPGTAAVGTQARRGCAARLGGYLNPQLASAILAESYIFPDQGAWNAGERTVVCEIRSTEGKLTGSVRGLG
jgi:hypothetical protein